MGTMADAGLPPIPTKEVVVDKSTSIGRALYGKVPPHGEAFASRYIDTEADGNCVCCFQTWGPDNKKRLYRPSWAEVESTNIGDTLTDAQIQKYRKNYRLNSEVKHGCNSGK